MLSLFTRIWLLAILPFSLAGEVNADLLRAARKGDTDTVKKLLTDYREEIAEANSGVPAVKAAAEGGHTKTVLALIESPAVDRSKVLQSAALLAAKGGFIDTVLAVTQLGGPDLMDSATVSAVAFEQTDLARLLIAQGGRVRASDRTTATAATILSMLATRGSTELMHLMLESGADPNRMGADGRYPLTAAARAGRVDALRLLLDVGTEVNATNKDGRIALSHATEKGWREIVRILLAAGADTESRNPQGQTVLMEVAATSRSSLLDTLLEWDAEVDADDSEGRTALMVAAEAGRLDNVRTLLSHKPDLDAKDNEGRTAADYAGERRRNDIIKAIEAEKKRR